MSVVEVAQMLNDYGARLHGERRYLASVSAFARAVRTDPQCAEAHNGLGVALMNLGRYAEAEPAYRRALELNPKSGSAWANLALLLNGTGRSGESEAAFDRALLLNPGDLGARWNRSNVLLERGDWARGLDEYEVRIPFRGSPNFPRMPYPMWNGEDLSGKTIYIQAEQGIGDRILCSRYLPLLKQKFPTCTILYLSKPQMHALMWEFRDAVTFLPEGIPWPKADYGLFEMSLLRYFQTRTDAVPADPGLFKKRALQAGGEGGKVLKLTIPAMKVGLCWTGNPEQDRNAERSVPLEMLLPLAEDPNVVLVSLQVGSRDIQRLGAEQLICDISNDLVGQLHRTASTIMELDLVITCCTSIAHLAGALGVPTIVMLCHNPYWVWLKNRDDSVWYPSVRLVRQPKPNDWASVVTQVQTLLDERVRTWTDSPMTAKAV